MAVFAGIGEFERLACQLIADAKAVRESRWRSTSTQPPSTPLAAAP
jgi:hypothetical protein